MLALDDTTRELHFLAVDLVQVVTKHGHNLADFSVGGIVGKDDVFIPNKLAFRGFHLLRSGEDVDVLRRGEEAQKAKQE